MVVSIVFVDIVVVAFVTQFARNAEEEGIMLMVHRGKKERVWRISERKVMCNVQVPYERGNRCGQIRTGVRAFCTANTIPNS
jgi:hypothetical protein